MNIPRQFSRWRHRKSGTEYTVIMITNRMTNRPDQFPVTVVYMDNTGADYAWSRPLSEWTARFEEVTR